MVGSACQYCIVATATTSSSPRSIILRGSMNWAGVFPYWSLIRAASAALRVRSGSHTAVTRTPDWRANRSMWCRPRIPQPTTPTRISSLAPSTWRGANTGTANTAEAAAVPRTN
jgi:hypothetical protein